MIGRMIVALFVWLCAIAVGVALWHLAWWAGAAWFAALIARYLAIYNALRPKVRRDTGVTYVAGQAWRERRRKGG